MIVDTAEEEFKLVARRILGDAPDSALVFASRWFALGATYSAMRVVKGMAGGVSVVETTDKIMAETRALMDRTKSGRFEKC
jgi:hypothetical protein